MKENKQKPIDGVEVICIKCGEIYAYFGIGIALCKKCLEKRLNLDEKHEKENN